MIRLQIQSVDSEQRNLAPIFEGKLVTTEAICNSGSTGLITYIKKLASIRLSQLFELH